MVISGLPEAAWLNKTWEIHGACLKRCIDGAPGGLPFTRAGGRHRASLPGSPPDGKDPDPRGHVSSCLANLPDVEADGSLNEKDSHTIGHLSLHMSEDMFEGSTGCHLWEAGSLLSEFVLNNPSIFKGTQIYMNYALGRQSLCNHTLTPHYSIS